MNTLYTQIIILCCISPICMDQNVERVLVNPQILFSAGLVSIGSWTATLREDANLAVHTGVEDCRFFEGHLIGERKSRVALTNCDGLYYGVIAVENDIYTLEPTSTPAGGHVVWRAGGSGGSGTRSRRQATHSFNLTGDAVLDTWTDEEFADSAEYHDHVEKSDSKNNQSSNLVQTKVISRDRIANVSKDPSLVEHDATTQPEMRVRAWPRARAHDEFAYFADVEPVTRPINVSSNGHRQRWLELALAVDHTVVEFHGHDRVRHYVLALMNIVSAIFKDPSLDSNIQLVITRLFFLEKKDSLVREGNAKKSLEAVNRWNYRLLNKLKPGSVPHDAAIWLTRMELGGPSGYAPVEGVCSRRRGAALNRDEGLTSAFVVAHELAHLLGLSHDGDSSAGNSCSAAARGGSVMAPVVSSTLQRFLWSFCSRTEFHKLSKKWLCTQNKPARGRDMLRDIADVDLVFSMDEQCRMEFGDGYGLCQLFELPEPCAHLWCGHAHAPALCKIKTAPPLEGTRCARDKWCIDGYCQAVEPRLARAGGRSGDTWGAWGAWSACNSALRCGYGVRVRTRKCHGHRCSGVGEQQSLCASQRSCAAAGLDARAELCRRSRNDRHAQPVDPREHETSSCEVLCESSSGAGTRYSAGAAPPGTACSYESEHRVCFRGKCESGHGCDFIGSGAARRAAGVADACGECSGGRVSTGAGASCQNATITQRITLTTEWRSVVRFPKLSRRVYVVVLGGRRSSSAFALRDHDSRLHVIVPASIDNTLENIHNLEGRIVVEGASFGWKLSQDEFELRATGPTIADVVLMAAAGEGRGESVLVSANYSIHKKQEDATDALTHRWVMERGECSVSCGGGRRAVRARCVDAAGKNAALQSCNGRPRPDERLENCNQESCSWTWVTGSWEACSATCGESGVQARAVWCVPAATAFDLVRARQHEPQDSTSKQDQAWLVRVWRAMGSPRWCGTPPATSRPCRRLPCPAYWMEGGWGQCSTECGQGVSTQKMYCANSTGTLVTPSYWCGKPPAPHTRTCRTRVCPRARRARTCTGDTSQYCELRTLLRYCDLPPYRRLCCRSCERYAYMKE